MNADNIEHLGEVWSTLNEYIPAKEKLVAAEHLIDLLADWGFADDELKTFAEGDIHLTTAVDDFLGDVDDDEDLDDYDE
jgi:hypothetical protein